MTKLLIVGSRVASEDMLAYARNAVARAKELGQEIIVGDEEGVDAAVIIECDRLNVPVVVYGANNKLQRMSQTGTNIAHPITYPERGEIMAQECDECIAIWNGTSHNTKQVYDTARKYSKKVYLKTF